SDGQVLSVHQLFISSGSQQRRRRRSVIRNGRLCIFTIEQTIPIHIRVKRIQIPADLFAVGEAVTIRVAIVVVSAVQVDFIPRRQPITIVIQVGITAIGRIQSMQNLKIIGNAVTVGIHGMGIGAPVIFVIVTQLVVIGVSQQRIRAEIAFLIVRQTV